MTPGRRAILLGALASALPTVASSGAPRAGLYREVPFAELVAAPVGGTVSAGPVTGLREDQVRAKAVYTGRFREATMTDTRLLDAWMLARRFTRPGQRVRWVEAEFTDGAKTLWLPVHGISFAGIAGSKAGDELELYVHRVDAPHAGAELAGSAAVVVDASRVRR